MWTTNRAEHRRAARRDTILCRCLLRDSFLKLWARSYRVSKPPFVPHVLLLTPLDPCFFKKPPSLMMHGLKSFFEEAVWLSWISYWSLPFSWLIFKTLGEVLLGFEAHFCSIRIASHSTWSELMLSELLTRPLGVFIGHFAGRGIPNVIDSTPPTHS